jgi:Xaa-Pro aminopeptidase
MFATNVYVERRNRLKAQMQSGLILFLGNDESPINYRDNAYPFRQDSSFLYFWGLDSPGLAATLDIDEDKAIVYGNDPTIDEIVWMGPQIPLREKSRQAGVTQSLAFDRLEADLSKALQQGRSIHFLPPYRADKMLKLGSLLSLPPAQINRRASIPLIEAVVAQRSIKSTEEIAQIEAALEISAEMHVMAMRMSKPAIYEREVAGAMEGLVISKGAYLAFPTIFSVHGETLHNHYHGNLMKAGDMAVNDSGAESALHYASDITRTIPIGGKFSQRQQEIYRIVLDTQEKAMAAVKPGVKFKDVHLLACKSLASGLKELGLMKGNVDEAVAAGAHALFFQCGLGHMMGLDVHDMEDLGEDFVGYDEETSRSTQFGLRSLRLAKKLQPGFVVTVEPGLYFIPQLIDMWKAENKFSQYLNYATAEKFKDFGGVRIEDDVLVVENGHRVLGRPIPKTIAEVEALASG